MKKSQDSKDNTSPAPASAASDGAQPQSAQQILALAIGHHGAGNLVKAGQACEQVLDVAPNHPVALHLWGVVQLQSGQNEAAVTSLQKAVAADPNNPEVHSNLGAAFAGTGQTDRAVAHYRKAIALNPKSASALNNLGFSLMALGQTREALESYHQALALAPTYVDAHNNLGVAYLALAELDKAADCFTRALEIKPDFARAQRNLGTTCREQGKPEEAIASYQNALALNPNDATIHNDLGFVLMLLGRLEEAISSYRAALKLKPDYKQAQDNLGDALRAHGQLDEAIESFEKANLGSSSGKILETLFELGRYDAFFERASEFAKTDATNIRAAAISAYASQQLGRDDPFSFCKTPLDFIHIGAFADQPEGASPLIDALSEQLDQLTPLWEGNTTKRGYQTLNNLFQNPQGALARLEQIIRAEIETCFANHASNDCLYVRRKPEQYRLNGWFVRLLDQGHQSVHNHPTGWMSGVVYLKAPLPNQGGNEGAIEFGLHGNNYPTLTDDHPKVVHQPTTGEIVLFPSSLFHRTVPITTREERWSIAFDVVPE